MIQEFIQTINSTYGVHISLRDVILTAMSPLFILAFFLEYRYLKKKGLAQQIVSIKESILNFSLGATYQIAEGLVNLLFLAVLLKWVEQFQLFHIPATTLGAIALLLILEEFFYYWFHRTSHRVRWFWAAHVVHHSSERMNLSTAMRQSIFYPLSGNFLFFLPIVLIGFSAEAVFAMYAVNLAYQYFVHTQVISKLHPAFEFIFNTPSHHRAHHGRNEKYIDKNYGGILIIFDRLFGTFVEEDEDVPVEYGIVRQIDTLNLIKVNVHEWKDMFGDVIRTKSLKPFYKPPEWLPLKRE